MDPIGDNETPGSVGPVDLGAGRTAVGISAGGSHTCALLDNGTIRCWGDGAYGKLGYGNTDTIGDNETPGGYGPVSLGGSISTRGEAKLSLSVKPKHDSSKPFELNAKGSLTGDFALDQATCAGKVELTTKAAHKSAKSSRARLTLAGGKCTYAKTLKPKSAGKLTIKAGLPSSSNLKAAKSPAVKVRAG
jgi:hypothetical protein